MSAAAAGRSGSVFDDIAPELTRNYAEALLQASGDQAEAVVEELEGIKAEILDAHPDFAALLASPTTPPAAKDRLLAETLDGRALDPVVRFLRVLNRHGRLSILPAVIRQARATLDRRLNRKAVTVRSAVPLDEAQQAALRDRLAALVDATPVVTLEVDPALIGGLVVQVGDAVYDASVRNRLERLRGRLMER
jgi:F-type H+-transporting ATPase subunit delta